MKIQNDVAHWLLPVEGKFEGQVVGLDYEFFLQFARRFEYLGVVSKSGWPNEHVS